MYCIRREYFAARKCANFVGSEDNSGQKHLSRDVQSKNLSEAGIALRSDHVTQCFIQSNQARQGDSLQPLGNLFQYLSVFMGKRFILIART